MIPKPVVNVGFGACAAWPLAEPPLAWLDCLMVRFVQPTEPRLLARLTAHREKFAMTLVGRWSTAQGTFDLVMSGKWEFCTDGRLIITSHDGSEPEVYAWRQIGSFQVEIGTLPDEDWSEGTWRAVKYEFTVMEHDAGHEVVLREEGCEGFWLSDVPLGAQG